MNLDKESKNKLSKLISNLGEEDTSENSSLAIQDPILELRNATANFLSHRFSKFKEDTAFATSIRNAILKKIEEGGVSFSELTSTLDQTRRRETEAVESILQFFKPSVSGESANSLFSSSPKEEGTEIDHKSLQTLEVLRRLLTSIEKENKPEDVLTEE